MPAYLIVEIVYADREWTEAYRRDVPALLARAGARYVAKSLSPERIGGAGPDPDDGDRRFPSAAAARAFLSSPDYAPYLRARQAALRTRMYLIDG